MPKHLIEAFRPTEALVPGVDEGNGLLVVEHGGGAISDTTAFDNGARGKLDILREQMPFPAAAFFEHVGGNEKARSRNSAARVEREARLAQVFRLSQEPNGIAGGNPVASIIFRIAVARGGFGAAVENLIHFAEVIRVEHVVSVEDEIRFEALGVVAFLDFVPAVVQCVALADLLIVKALVHIGRTSIACDFRSVVGAVVGNHENADELLRVVLHANAVNEVTDNLALIAGRNHRGIFVIGLGFLQRRFAREHDEYVVELVDVADAENQQNGPVEDVNERHMRKHLLEHGLLAPIDGRFKCCVGTSVNFQDYRVRAAWGLYGFLRANIKCATIAELGGLWRLRVHAPLVDGAPTLARRWRSAPWRRPVRARCPPDPLSRP